MNKQKLKERKNKMRNSKGITLVALIITIIVLLILAVVAIAAVNDGGIIQHTQEASSDYSEAQEKEQIGLAHNEWSIQKHYPNNGGYNFKSFMTSKLVDATSVTGEEDGPLTVTMKSEKVYTVTDDGIITPVEKDISVSADKTTLAPEETATLTVSGVGGLQVDPSKITYSSDKPEFATVSTAGTVTAVAAGTAEITVTYDGIYTKKVTITVQAPVADNWDYAWICTETTTDGNTTRAWDDTMYTPATLPTDYVIIAKFYKNEDQEKMTINGVEDYPCTMKIEGNGPMASLWDRGASDQSTAAKAWYHQITNYSGYGEVLIAFTTKVEINNGITHIGDRVFNTAMSLSEIKYTGTKAEWDNVTIGEDVFEGVPSTAKIICSDGTEVAIPSGE